MNIQAQDSVVKLFKGDLKRADTNFQNDNFQSALELYQGIADKKSYPREVDLKIARCYYFLKQYKSAEKTYDRYKSLYGKLPKSDLYAYAEIQSGLGHYQKAIASYKNYLEQDPDSEIVISKIWRLNNIQFLYEDSLHFAVRYISLNAESGEFSAVPHKQGIVFTSNRKHSGLVQKVDAASNNPFYKLYYSHITQGTFDSLRYEEATVFGKGLSKDLHVGPCAFYDNGQKMVFVSNLEGHEAKAKSLGLFFAEYNGKSWQVTSEFQYNGTEFSNTHPTMSSHGKTLLFSSNRAGGYGGKDIYQSDLVSGQWTAPKNMGATINTSEDEVYPFLHANQTLYFSSTGHPGLGGLDIFKIILSEGINEVENVGYPLNSSFDDFAIYVDSLSGHGYFTSNRKNGGLDDDIYEFDMDIQTYPLAVSGIIKYIEHNWIDSSELKLLPNVKLFLIDNIRNVTVAESTSDENGKFTLEVPYFSTYKVRVVGQPIEEGIVSFEVPKHRKQGYTYEIVVVNDDFKSEVSQDDDR